MSETEVKKKNWKQKTHNKNNNLKDIFVRRHSLLSLTYSSNQKNNNWLFNKLWIIVEKASEKEEDK